MSDENSCITPCNPEKITEEQRARISQNFRAAKALLARKRKRDHNIGAQGSATKRLPLQEIVSNTLPSPSKNVFKSTEHGSSCRFKGIFAEGNGSSIGCFSTTRVRVSTRVENVCENKKENSAQADSRTSFPPVDEMNNTPAFFSRNTFRLAKGELSPISCPKFVPEDNSTNDSSGASKAEVSIENEYASDSFRTPVKPLYSSGYSNSFSVPSILDDDFDESILGDIDIICEQQSIAKADRKGDSNNFLENFQHRDDKKADFSLCLETVRDSKDQNAQYTMSSGYLSESKPNGSSSHQTMTRCENLKIEFQMDPEDASDLMPKSNNPMPESMPEEYTKYLLSLNERQREAACNDISVPLMIAAGPGSGKTSTMVGRILMLLHEGMSPSNILAMTFTTAAVAEMRDRVGSVAGKAAAKELTISTFHSFSLQLCRSHAEKLGRTPEFLIYGHGQQKRAIIEAIRLLENKKNGQSDGTCKVGEDLNSMNSPQYFKDKSKKWLKFVNQAKASGRSPEEYDAMGDEIGAAILRNYGDILQSCNALDYHDLISCAVKLLTNFPEVFKESQDLWKAIVIDEFQDTSAMQYKLMRILASHNCITIIGDDDQSIFSFNGADISGFDSFRRDFPNYKEVRLNKNYRSTRCIVEAASYLIQNNAKRCQLKSTLTDNSFGAKITIKECHNEVAQCSFVVDKILEATSTLSSEKSSYGDIAILYRRQVSGKVFQIAFRDRKIPFNLHGVAFYRKKAVKAIIAMLRTALPGCDDNSYRQVFKALLPFDKEEKKKVIAHIDKVLTIRKCSFISAASDIYSAKISGTFKRSQLTQGRKVLSTLDIISRLVHREQSLSAVITSVANMVPQKYLLEQRAVVDVDGGKLLNEDHDLRSVLQYLLDDVSDFLSTQYVATEVEGDDGAKTNGCVATLKAFIGYITERESENFRSRRQDNKNSVTLTTIHQSKGLEWDTVFIVKANESEIPLLHEYNGVIKENANSIEEERRLFYVAMTRARKKLFILYITMDTNWQMLLPSRFLKEIPDHLRELQCSESKALDASKETPLLKVNHPRDKQSSEDNVKPDNFSNEDEEALGKLTEPFSLSSGTSFLRRFSVEERNVVSHLFNHWAKKQAFQDPKRLLGKVGFVIDERLRDKKNKHKDVLRALKSSLGCDEAFQYAEYVLRWLQIPADERAHIMREKQEHFQKLRAETSMGSSAPTSKQISYLQNLGCTITPTSRLHASRLIEQYRSL